MAERVPRFVVVGHPNKGKSSIVATLSEDAHVAIAPEPGTTRQSSAFPMRVDGRVLYELVDTPGFERARRALEWMKRHETTADKRSEVVAMFVAEHRGDPVFSREVELLRPLVEEDVTAGVLYVVDGSKPYGPEYEPEMEILRWTGQPSMALINPIGSAAHVEPWRRALEQYFRVVRVFDAVSADWDKRIELLRAFGQLREGWREPLEQAVAALQHRRGHRQQQASQLIAALAVDALRLSVEQVLPADADADAVREVLASQYREALRALEQRARERVEEAYGFDRLERDEQHFNEQLGDLFDARTQLRFGLDMLGETGGLLAGGGTGALLGAKAGAAVDLATGGLTLGLGTLGGSAIGGLLGATGGWVAGKPVSHWLSKSSWGRRLAAHRVNLGLPVALGQQVARFGPSKNPQTAFVLLGRALWHQQLVAHRTHARQDRLHLDAPPPAWDPTRRDAVLHALKPVLRNPADDWASQQARQSLAHTIHPWLMP